MTLYSSSKDRFSMAGRESLDGRRRPQNVAFPASESSALPTVSANSEHIPMQKPVRDTYVPSIGRTSRASSIVSTRTRISISTLQEDARSARSVDLVLGGRSFHINRDGSKVTSVDDGLPPYSALVPEVTAPDIYSAGSESSSPTTPTGQYFEPAGFDRSNEPQDYAMSHLPPVLSSRLQIETHPDVPKRSRNSNSPDSSIISTRNQTATLSPHRVREHGNVAWRSNSLDIARETFQSPLKMRRSLSHGNLLDTLQLTPMNTLRRKTGFQLPRIFTALSGGKFSTSSSSLSEHGEEIPMSTPIRATYSAGPSFESVVPSDVLSSSSMIVGREARGKFSSVSDDSVGRVSVSKTVPSWPQCIKTMDGSNDGSLVIPESPVRIEEGHAGAESPPPMDTENDISIHYTRLIRSIDRDHRRALHERDQELAAMRERLNEVDQVYRQELRARDFTIEDLRQRLTGLQENMETQIQRARNEVEDLWEKRWKDRDKHLVERMRRMELDGQRNVEQAIAKRDEEWTATWAKRNEQLSQQLQEAQEMAKQSPILP